MKTIRLKNMVFEKRVKTVKEHMNGTLPCQEITIDDYFQHKIKDTHVIRRTHTLINAEGKVYQCIRWLKSKNSGNAGLSYWLNEKI